MNHPTQVVKRNAATCIREIAKHTPEVIANAPLFVCVRVCWVTEEKRALLVQLAQLIVNQGGHGAIIDYCKDSKGDSRLPGLMALGMHCGLATRS